MISPFDATLMVIAKSPQPGRVKTRLCPPCTSRQAADIAAAALEDTLATVAAVPAARHVLVLDGPSGPWIPARFDVVPQVGGGLGERLDAAFAAIVGPAFLVGMDTPQLTVAQCVGALCDLASPNVDAVLGRATDGGWWGLGLSRPAPAMFDGVPMSSSDTGRAQLDRMRCLGLRTRLLPELCDVDHFSDALAVATVVPGSRFAAAVALAESSCTPAARVS
jgi:rSAM/selenodomain-associated transferase 1